MKIERGENEGDPHNLLGCLFTYFLSFGLLLLDRPPVTQEEFERQRQEGEGRKCNSSSSSTKEEDEEEEEEEEESEEEGAAGKGRPDIQTESAELTLRRAQVNDNPSLFPSLPPPLPPSIPPSLRLPTPSPCGQSSSRRTPNALATPSFSMPLTPLFPPLSPSLPPSLPLCSRSLSLSLPLSVSLSHRIEPQYSTRTA